MRGDGVERGAGPDGEEEERTSKRPPSPPPSFGNISDHHWSRSRAGANQDAIEYMQQRSKAPGVESGGAERNHYCMQCQGVIPLRYDSRVPLEERLPEHCPHCGAALEGRVRAMFNWVEIDQVAGSDAKALLPLFVGALTVLALVVLGIVWLVF